MNFDKVKQKLTVRTADRIKFVDEIIALGAMGAVQRRNSVPKLTAPFMADFVIEVDPKKPMVSTATVIAYPPDIKAYTEIELSKMTFEEFREAVALVGVKGRERDKMLKSYLDYFKNKVD